MHMENRDSSETTSFNDLLKQLGLTQHIAEPTRILDGWLDVVITRDDCIISEVIIEPPVISDRCLPHLHTRPIYDLRHMLGWKNLDRPVQIFPAYRTPA